MSWETNNFVTAFISISVLSQWARAETVMSLKYVYTLQNCPENKPSFLFYFILNDIVFEKPAFKFPFLEKPLYKWVLENFLENSCHKQGMAFKNIFCSQIVFQFHIPEIF